MFDAALRAVLTAEEETRIEFVLADGTYNVASEYILNKPVVIRSASGDSSKVILNCTGDSRLFTVNHAQAILSGVTVQGGTNAKGGNILFPENGTGGMVSNCVIKGANITSSAIGGGIALLSGGLVTHCRITGNRIAATEATKGGAGVYLNHPDAIVRNCLVDDNGYTTRNNGDGCPMFGAGVRIEDGLLESCTVANNRSRACSGVYASGGTIRNCVIGANWANNYVPLYSADEVFAGENAVFDHCVAPVYLNETCFVDPLPFFNAGGKDYRLMPNSPAVDGASVQSWMAGSVDLNGTSRTDGRPDIGAYECADKTAFATSFTHSSMAGCAPLKVTLQARIANPPVGEACVKWTLSDRNGTTTNLEGMNVEHTFEKPLSGVGFAEVSCALYIDGRKYAEIPFVNSAINSRRIYVRPKTIWIAPEGNESFPYETRENAFRSFAAALKQVADGAEIIVAQGVYTNTAGVNPPLGLNIRGATGRPEDVIVKGKGRFQVFALSHPSFRVSALTLDGELSGSSGTAGGLGVHIGFYGGSVSNCVVRNFKPTHGNYRGGGLFCSGPGVVSHCVFTNNNAQINTKGTAVYLTDGRLENCLLVGNGSTVTANGNQNTASGGTIAMEGGTVVNCTLADNTSYTCSGVFATGGRVVNTIIAGNTLALAKQPADVWKGDAARFTHCLGDTALINDNCWQGDPKFVAEEGGDWRLDAGSPCIDAGLPGETFAAIDLAGSRRVSRKGIDLGCYERFYPDGLFIVVR